MYLIVPLIGVLSHLLVKLWSCLSFIVVVFSILVPICAKSSCSLPRRLLVVLVWVCLGSILNLRYWAFTALTTEIVLTSQIVHFVVVHHVDSSGPLTWFRLLVFAAAPLRIGAFFLLDDKLLPRVCVDLLNQQVRLLLLAHLSNVLLLCFVLLKSLFRLIGGQFRVRSPFWEVWIVTSCLLLLG
jgi:hypothetical protein